MVMFSGSKMMMISGVAQTVVLKQKHYKKKKHLKIDRFSPHVKLI